MRHRNKPSPYLERVVSRHQWGRKNAVWFGLSGDRNCRWLAEQGFSVVSLLDTVANTRLGHDVFPVEREWADLLVASYVFGMLDPVELMVVMGEVEKVAAQGCLFIVELAVTKKEFKSEKDLLTFKSEFVFRLSRGGWNVHHNTRKKFTLIKQ